jgi:predicted esterase
VSFKFTRVLAVTALAAACVAILSAAALGRARGHADLRIVSSSVKRAGVTASQPVFSGGFTVANVGTATARVFHGWIELTAAKRPAKIVSRYSAGPLKARGRLRRKAKVKIPKGLAKVPWTIEACVMPGKSRSTKPAKDGCRKLATYDLAPKATTVAPVPKPATTSTTTTTTIATPPSTVPAQPITGYVTNSPYWVADGLGQYQGAANSAGTDPTSYGGYYTSGYYVVVPPSYDASNKTPETLLVWMHGCEGTAHWDAQDLTAQFNSDRPYILISLSGPENGGVSPGPECWDTSNQADVSKVLTDITNVETHFNINRRRVIIAGYSSGGDLAYQTIFTHASTFAGILAYNTNPVRDNTFGAAYGLDAINDAIAGAAWKFPIIQVSHDHDDVYHVDRCGYPGYPVCPSGDPSGSTNPDQGVSPAIAALQSAGFPVTFTVVAGNHYNPDMPVNCNDSTPGTCTSGDGYEIVNDLLSHIATSGWESPAS